MFNPNEVTDSTVGVTGTTTTDMLNLINRLPLNPKEVTYSTVSES